MKQTTLTRNRVTLLIMMMTLLSYQPMDAHSSSLQGSEKLTEEMNTAPLVQQVNTEDNQSDSESDSDANISQDVWLGIGAATAVVLGAVALNDSDSGGNEVAAAPATPEPPTADSLVAGWSVSGQQPGSGRSYFGTFYLYQGGGLGYQLSVSDGENLSGGGGWNLWEYTLQIKTDHGSTYQGVFTQGSDYNSIELTSDTAWVVTMSRL
jgi:hypothetical protein